MIFSQNSDKIKVQTKNQSALDEVLGISKELIQAGLKIQHLAILGHLVSVLEQTDAINDDLVAIESIDAIAKATHLSYCKVQRGLDDLSLQGYIVRRQCNKRDGEVAKTLVTLKALRLFGIETDLEHFSSMPSEVARLVIGENRQTLKAVALAWKNKQELPDLVEKSYRGSAYFFEQLKKAFSERLSNHLNTCVDQAQALASKRHQESRGEFEITVGKKFLGRFSFSAFKSACKSYGSSFFDPKFVLQTLEEVENRKPGSVSKESLPRLIAEIGFSRALGFVKYKDARDAIIILASCVLKRDWSRPRGMSKEWYEATLVAVS